MVASIDTSQRGLQIALARVRQCWHRPVLARGAFPSLQEEGGMNALPSPARGGLVDAPLPLGGGVVEAFILPLLLGVLIVGSMVETGCLPHPTRLGGTDPQLPLGESVSRLCWPVASVSGSCLPLPVGREKLRRHALWILEVEAGCIVLVV